MAGKTVFCRSRILRREREKRETMGAKVGLSWYERQKRFVDSGFLKPGKLYTFGTFGKSSIRATGGVVVQIPSSKPLIVSLNDSYFLFVGFFDYIKLDGRIQLVTPISNLALPVFLTSNSEKVFITIDKLLEWQIKEAVSNN